MQLDRMAEAIAQLNAKPEPKLLAITAPGRFERACRV
jgi:hypothetical protein